jgi:hypothetical protein
VVVQQKRRTQSAEYWLDELAVHKDDILHLYEWLLEENEPRTIDQLSLRLIEHRSEREEQALLKQSDKGAIYQPQEQFEVGQHVVFPALDYAVGEVVGLREGNNSRYGPFSVIQVQMESGSDGVREFAADFVLDHPLNRSAILLDDSDDILSSAKLYELYGHNIAEQLHDALLQSEDFVRFRGKWFLRGLMPEVTTFHLNIAEATIDVRGQPLTVSQLLEEVDLPVPEPTLRTYALSYALSQDPRFAETSLDGEPTWYLSALIPDAVSAKPARLVPVHTARGGEWLNRELRDFVEEIQDEADELDHIPVSASGDVDSVRFFLNYPHRREGTLPLTAQALGLLVERPSERFIVTFVDSFDNDEMPGWMIPGERYAWGLGEWYQRHGIPIGGEVELRRGDDPFRFFVSYQKGKRRSEWIKMAAVVNGHLTFSMQRKAHVCRYDKHLLMDAGSSSALDPLWVSAGVKTQSLFEHLTEVFPELAKLSGQGLVHAKSLYSAVNLTRRCGAVPIFAELTRRACFDPVGDGNWIYDESLRDVSYNTLEEMRQRPSSHRQDLIVDTVRVYGVSSED